MAEGLLQNSGNSRRKWMLPIGILLVIILGGVLLVSLRGAEQVREQLLRQQEEQYNAPNVAIKRQVQRILIKKQTAEGLRYYEIFQNGLVNEYDEHMNLLRSGLQGFGRISGLFDDINQSLDGWMVNGSGSNYEIIVHTNQGTYTIPQGSVSGTPGPTSPSGGGIDDVIDDIIDDTFSPTPTLIPTPTAVPGQPTNTPMPTATARPTNTPTIDPFATPVPSGLPQYMLNPPFDCEDLNVDKPTVISNVICLPN